MQLIPQGARPVMSISPPISPKNRTLRTKMTLLYMVASAAILLMTAASLFLVNQSRIGGTAYTTITNCQNALGKIAQLKSDLHQIIAEAQILLTETDKGVSIKSAATIMGLSRDVDQRLTEIQELVEQPAERNLINKTDAFWKEYRKTLLEEVVPASQTRAVLKSRTLMTGIQAQRFTMLNRTITSLTDDLRQSASAAEDHVSSVIRVSMIFSILAAILTIGVIALFFYAITTSATRPLGRCTDYVTAIADGKLDGRLDVSGPAEVATLAMAINRMTENLHSRILRISSASETLASIENNLEKNSRNAAHSARH